MTTGSLDTVIRMNVDSAQGVAATNKLDGAMTNLKSRGVNSLGSGFGSLATQAIAASGAQERLGVQGTFLSGSLSMVAQSVGMLNPLLLGAVIVGTAAVTMFLNKRQSVEDLRATLDKYRSDLEKVAKGDSEYVAMARQVLEGRRQLVEQELKEIEAKVALASVGLKEASMMDRLIAFLSQGGGVYGVLAAQISLTTVAGDEQTTMLAGLISQWQKANESLGRFTRTSNDVAGSVINLKLKWLDLEEGIAQSTSTEAESLVATREIATTRAQLMREQLAISLQDEHLADEEKRHMRLNTEMEIELMFALLAQKEWAYHEKVRDMHRETTVDLSAEFKEREKLFKTYVVHTQNQYAVLGSAFQRLIGGQTALHGGFAAFIVQTTGEAVQAMLKHYAVIWAAEAAANIITNPAVAASKARAAAMAGVAVGVVGAITSVAVGAITARSEMTLEEQLLSDYKTQQERDAARQRLIDQGLISPESQSLAGTDSGSRSSGRTLVQQGPLTLNYRATMIVNGHVFDIDDVYQMWQNFNANQLRAAGVQSDELRT